MNKNIKNIQTILTVLIVAIVIISGSSMSITINKITCLKDYNFTYYEEENKNSFEPSTGIAPNIKQKQNKNIAIDNQNDMTVNNNGQLTTKPLADTMWGYIVNSSYYDKGPCYFNIFDPNNINIMSYEDFFLSGGTWVWECYGRWIACQYDNGALWEIDHNTGEMKYIGGGGASLNGLTFDVLTNRLYGASSTDLYEIDIETGEQTYIGPFGDNVNLMIAIASDDEGHMYGWDLGDKLWSIDTETGEAITIGPLGIDINYAQDGHFLYAEDRLILTAYTTKGQLYECDKETGSCFFIGDLEDGAQITASAIPYVCPCACHDIGIKSINKPEYSSYAVPEIAMQCQVKNYGSNLEITDVQMKVEKYEKGPIIFAENFSGIFPPEGWTTDYWMQSNTSNAGGEFPEVICDSYTQYNNNDYFDNYIMSPALNLSNVTMAEIEFKFKGDINHDNCFFYIKYRENSSCSWKDCTPWNNPIKKDFGPEDFKARVFGDPYLGKEFQVKWEHKGHYSHFNYWWLDDIKISYIDQYIEYNEIVEDVLIELYNEKLIDFPIWTPSDWQNPEYENKWQEYHVKAYTLLADDIPKNNYKEKIVKLYFPWMHDIEITSVDSPCEDGPGKTYPVQATIKNVGQCDECCISINISIGGPVVLDTILIEESWETVPPDGWTDEHKNYASNYGWNKSYTSYSGGSSPEARLPYNYALPEKIFYSYAFNTSDYSICQLDFLSYINHYSGQGLYALEAGYSYDGINWFASWHEKPGKSGIYDVSVQFESGYETTYIGFWLKGDPWYMNSWYIDNVEVKDVDIISEYTDYMCQGPDIEPGESVTIEFEDWTPDFLQYETTGSKDYIIHAEIDIEGDNNPSNDNASELFTLNYWHDSEIEVTSPYTFRDPDEWLGYDDGTAVNSLGLTAGGTFEYAIRLTPDELAAYGGYVITYVKRHHGLNTPFTMNGIVKIYGQGTSTNPGNLITEQPFSCYEADWHEIPLDTPVPISGDEDIWVSIEVSHASGQNPAAMDASNNYPGKGDFIYLSSWVEVSIYGFYTDWLIRAGVEPGSCCPKKVYIQPGTQDIGGLATNLGTFPEHNLTCWAEIYDYIDDPKNGTLIYEDNITNIDLDDPLGGTQNLEFNEFNFDREGIYILLLEMPDSDDDYQRNNKDKLFILIDDTKPVSTHSLDPATPDGENGWYVSDVEVTLDAYDPEGHGVSLWVKEIKYKINNGVTQTITGDHGTFILDKDKENLSIEYWAIDGVGNEEIHHTFTIDMDQTEPFIKLRYTYEDGPIPGKPPWRMIFTVFAYDLISQMDRVIFLINDVEQDVINGPGPEYQWEFLYYGGLYLEIYAEAYDNAGNMNSDEIIDPKNINNIHNSQGMKILQNLYRPSNKIISLKGN